VGLAAIVRGLVFSNEEVEEKERTLRPWSCTRAAYIFRALLVSESIPESDDTSRRHASPMLSRRSRRAVPRYFPSCPNPLA
jgi:hypothetical protein